MIILFLLQSLLKISILHLHKNYESCDSNKGIVVTTDLPTNITPTVKEALDTKSVQCLLAELLMKTGLY